MAGKPSLLLPTSTSRANTGEQLLQPLPCSNMTQPTVMQSLALSLSMTPRSASYAMLNMIMSTNMNMSTDMIMHMSTIMTIHMSTNMNMDMPCLRGRARKMTMHMGTAMSMTVIATSTRVTAMSMSMGTITTSTRGRRQLQQSALASEVLCTGAGYPSILSGM